MPVTACREASLTSVANFGFFRRIFAGFSPARTSGFSATGFGAFGHTAVLSFRLPRRLLAALRVRPSFGRGNFSTSLLFTAYFGNRRM